MKETRLIEILRTFTNEELRSFEKFLLSPFVKSRRSIDTLLSYLKKFHPNYDSSLLDRQTAFGKLFPREKYDGKKMVNLIFDLTKAAENFLKHSTLENDETESLMFLCKGLLNKKLLDHSMRTAELIESRLKPGFSNLKEYYLKIRTIEGIKITYYMETGEQENFYSSLSRFYEATAIQFLIDYTWMMSNEASYNYSFFKKGSTNIIETIANSFDIKKFSKLIHKSDSIHKSLIILHYYILKTIDEPDNPDYYFLLKELAFKNLSVFDRDEKYAVLNYLNSYAIQKINSGKRVFLPEALEIYMTMFENDAYSSSESENLQIISYKNILNFLFSMKKDAAFIEDFVDKYADKLNAEDIIPVKNYSYACIYYYKKDYETAIETISKITHLNPVFKIDYRLLMLKSYYELNHIEQAFSLIDSFKHFLKNDKEISDEHKKECGKFIKIFSSLLKIKSGKANLDPLMLKMQFEKLNIIQSRGWLNEKIDEFLK